jgi:hypothetical protein
MVDTRWFNLANEFQEMGVDYQPTDLADPDWCIKELARLGYSISVTYVTRAWARQRFNREPDYPPGVEGMYTYQLWGPRYPDRGVHSSPLMLNLSEAPAIALFNIRRLEVLDAVQH